jgi:hypothetical protein
MKQFMCQFQCSSSSSPARRYENLDELIEGIRKDIEGYEQFGNGPASFNILISEPSNMRQRIGDLECALLMLSPMDVTKMDNL